MKNLISYSEFLLEGISPEIEKFKGTDTSIGKLYRMIDGPERRQLEGAGRLIDISIQNVQSPLKSDRSSNDYLTFTFSDIKSLSLIPF